MSQPRTIKDYFKRPAFAQSNKYIQPSSSPLSDPPSDLPSQFASSQQLPDHDAEPQTKAKDILSPGHANSNGSFHQGSSLSRRTSFNSSSQRIVKNGQEVVIDSDAESVSSLDSFEASEKLLAKFIASSVQVKESASHIVPKVDTSAKAVRARKNGQPHQNWRAMSEQQGKKYKFSLESLVARAVDDNETEANVEKARALLQGHSDAALAPEAKDNAPKLQEEALASALSTDGQETDFQRLLSAVKRTEALEGEKSWAFFMDEGKQVVPCFPTDSIDPLSGEAFLREEFTRERAFHSGILDFALSRNHLPDEVLMWIFQSVPVEPQDELRFAYCRAIKHAKSQRIASLIGSADIDQVFLNLNASPTAVNISEPIRPKISYSSGNTSRNWNCLLSVLELLRDIGDHLHVDTKKHTLCVLFRLTLDIAVANSHSIIAALESTINSLLEGIPQDKFEQTMIPISSSTFKSINDVIFQGRLLGHILSTSPKIALFRARLAMAFLFKDESQIEKSREEILNLRGIIAHLKRTRLDRKLQKARLSKNFDYTELKGITSLLNTVIDTGHTSSNFSDKQSERQFNADVDTLADQVKRIFSAIEDSGASHLKRTEAKQGLEALHYRIIYSVRSKPQIKSVFGQDDSDITSVRIMDGFLKRSRENTRTKDSVT